MVRLSNPICIPTGRINHFRFTIANLRFEKWRTACAVVVPCFNEAATIGNVVADVKPFLPNVIVVDDGSTDLTARVAKNSGAEILSLKTNSGKGAALRAGWKLAAEKKFDWVLMLDGDGQHSATDISIFFEQAENSSAKLIVGNRMRNAAVIPLLRRFVNRWMSQRLSKLTGMKLPDSQCGFWLAHLPTLLNLPLAANHFEIESEMLVAFAAARQKIEFVPVEAIYKSRASKIHPLTDTIRWLRWRLAQKKVNPAILEFSPAHFSISANEPSQLAGNDC
jgi:glycosyltransferase involved in cell wall biosynthesis